MAENDDELRKQVAIASRVIGVELGSTGHVSARVPGTDEMYVRCRGGGAEAGLRYTDLHHIRQVDFDGEGPGLGKRHFAPGETPVHGELYRARPDIGAVVHAHPYYTLLCGVTGLAFRPIFGGYAPGEAAMAILGVPEYSRAATVTDKRMANDMLEVMGDSGVVLLKGHGIVTAARTVSRAVSLALQIEHLAKITWEIAAAGLRAPDMAREDLDRYDPQNPNRGGPAPGRGMQAVPASERGWMVGHIHRLEETVGLPSWELDEDG